MGIKKTIEGMVIIMDKNFLTYLADRKYLLYKKLYITNEIAITSKQCSSRIEDLSAYEELCNVINALPYNEEKYVRGKFEEIREMFK